MADFGDLSALRELAREATMRDKRLLDELRVDIRELKSRAQTVKPRETTSISILFICGWRAAAKRRARSCIWMPSVARKKTVRETCWIVLKKGGRGRG